MSDLIRQKLKLAMSCILIHITKNDDDAPNLIYTLSQIKMCSLSKLINLLAVGQDKIIASIETDYSKKTLESFDDILEKVLDAVLSSLGNKAPLALIKWKNDLINKASINDPEQWCGYTQKIHGICNKIFSEHAEGVNNASYHFTDGLKSKIIEPLCWKLVSEGPATTIVEAWRNIIKQGASLLAMELFDKIVDGEKPVNS